MNQILISYEHIAPAELTRQFNRRGLIGPSLHAFVGSIQYTGMKCESNYKAIKDWYSSNMTL